MSDGTIMAQSHAVAFETWCSEDHTADLQNWPSDELTCDIMLGIQDPSIRLHHSEPRFIRVGQIFIDCYRNYLLNIILFVHRYIRISLIKANGIFSTCVYQIIRQ